MTKGKRTKGQKIFTTLRIKQREPN